VKVICEKDRPVGVVVVSLAENVFCFAELLIDPATRGIGTAVIRELLEYGNEIVGHAIDRAEACIFPSNIPSRKAFERAGFHLDSAASEDDAQCYRYARIS